MERCIYSNIDYDTEYNNYKIISNLYTETRLLYNYNKILSDKKNSNNYGSDIMKFIITSNELWKFNYSTGYTENIINSEEFTTLICNSILKYNLNESGNNKKLIGYPHIGFVDITIINSNIIVLPAHMFILEQFNDVTELSFNILYNLIKLNMKYYPDDYINKIFKSLYTSKILIKNKTKSSVILNTEYLSQNNQINVIDIINNQTNIKTEIKKQLDAVLAHDRQDIIKSNISHFVKIKDYNIDELFNDIYNKINVFELTRDMFNKALECMIKNDYISHDSVIQKIVY
jgi:hypothetical protein